MRGRPNLFASYASEQAILPTATQRTMVGLLLAAAILLPLGGLEMPGSEGGFLSFGFLGDSQWLVIINRALIFAIAALGLNLLTGVAGQVSLGHAFFMATGAYTAVVLGGESGRTVWGLGLPIWIWLPAAGIGAALVGLLVAPTAVRVRGLYLAIVTLGLVFVGQHLGRNLGFIAGGPTTGRDWPVLEVKLWKEESPLIDFARDGSWLGVELTSETKAYFFLLFMLIIFVLAAKNLARTRIGRSFAAVRDRDVAAEIMGVNEAKAKLQAFAISSFYAGVGGALLASFIGRVIPESWDLLLSVEFVAIILIGGAGTVAGTLMGSFFVVLTPRIVEDVTGKLAETAGSGGIFGAFSDLIITTGSGDFGFMSVAAQGPGLSVAQMNLVLFGVLIIVFLIAEPLGLFGIWIRIRNYWKGWPFTY